VEQEQVDLGMVISGGVSLGAYEAGYNWALIRMLARMREVDAPVRPELRDVAGASAGSINALLTAVYWCQDPQKSEDNTIEKNLLYKTWVDLGIEDLLVPPDDTENRSTLFSRRVLKKKAAAIMRHLRKPLFRDGCEVALGIAVTKAQPIIEEFQGIEIRHQAFSVPLTLKVKHGRLAFENRKVDANASVDLKYLEIPGVTSNPSKMVPQLLFASSAFPGAFPQVKLPYIYQGKRGSGYFIDGGVYNNTPLDLAIAMDRRIHLFFFLDPSSMRGQKRPKKPEPEKAPVGFLSSNLYPLANAADIYQKMFLYQTIDRYFRGHAERRLILSSRALPLTAGFLEHFGAFIDRNFRLYDYHVGVYDAIYNLAKALRSRKAFAPMGQRELMEQLAEYLGVPRSKEAAIAFKVFSAIEFGDRHVPRSNRYAAIYYAFKPGVPEDRRYSAENFRYFLRHLNLKYLPYRPHSIFASMVKDPDHWYQRPLRYVINRVTALENYHAEVDPSYRPVAQILNTVAWGAAALVRNHSGWEVQQINAPREKRHAKMRELLRLLPKEIAFDSVNGGMSFAWEASYYKDLGWIDGFDFRGSYNFQDRRDGGDFVRLDADVLHRYNDALTYGFGLSGFGNVERKFWDPESAYGLNAYVEFMEMLRASYVWRKGEHVNNHALYFGVENLPSLIYWLNR
jgi:predicted acylesterase/phospholipase RssA